MGNTTREEEERNFAEVEKPQQQGQEGPTRFERRNTRPTWRKACGYIAAVFWIPIFLICYALCAPYDMKTRARTKAQIMAILEKQQEFTMAWPHA